MTMMSRRVSANSRYILIKNLRTFWSTFYNETHVCVSTEPFIKFYFFSKSKFTEKLLFEDVESIKKK